MNKGSVATLNDLLAGNVSAIQRLKEAIDERDVHAVFRALFEALNWASSIDDRIREEWAPEGDPLDWAWRQRVEGAEVMPGVRFARNRVHHHWADAIYLDEGGLASPITSPMRSSAWRWRPLADLPPGDDDHGIDKYAEHLADRPVEATLLRLALAFEHVHRFLAPPRPDV
jgi:hypothetical protein